MAKKSTRSPKRSRSRLATLKDYASADIQRIDGVDLKRIDAMIDLKRFSMSHLMNMKLALQLCGQDRSEIEQSVRRAAAKKVPARESFSGKKSDMLKELHENFAFSAKRFREFADFLDMADTRLVAGAAGVFG